jgi:phospho-N-acetylmuramoyl-pentapeptide-transferase
MGGLLIVFCIIFPTLLWADLTNRAVQLVLFSTLWLGAIGFVDDYLKLVKKKSKGLVASEKLLGQTVLGLLLGIYLYVFPLEAGFATKTNVLFFKNFFVDFGWLYVPFVAVVVVASSNAVNLTDGLDGLAIGVVAFSAFAYLGMSYVVGNFRIAEYLNVLFIHSAGELTVFCATIVGAALGFLWFNSHPAEVFMGDTGSLALGGALGTVAVLIKQEVLLALVGGVFVIEALSVIVQVGYFKLSHGKRLLRMSPLHHHFELAGWSESKIVTRFWILAAICALLALSTLKIR